MKRIMAVAALSAALGVAACGDRDPGANPADAAESPSADPAANGGADAGAKAVADAPKPSDAPVMAASPAAPGAPAFATLYPGAVVTDPAITALGPDGRPGGIVSFTTEASPDQVVAFYRKRAEAAGLSSANTLNRGSARAYGAASAASDGDFLNVVADAVEDGQTHVQLSWTEGK